VLIVEAGSQPADIFRWGAKDGNLMLHLTNKHVFFILGGGQLPGCKGASRTSGSVWLS